MTTSCRSLTRCCLIRTKPNPPPACNHLAVHQRQQLRERHLWSERGGGTGGCVFCTCESLTASFRFTSLPGHESLQSGHVLLGEVVLSHHVLQRLQVTRNYQHGLHLVLALGSETRTSIKHVTWRAGFGDTDRANWISDEDVRQQTHLDESEQHQQRRDKVVSLEGGRGKGFPEEGICHKRAVLRVCGSNGNNRKLLIMRVLLLQSVTGSKKVIFNH